jgi:hypothetical protein
MLVESTRTGVVALRPLISVLTRRSYSMNTKLTLDLDSLRVQSFETEDGDAGVDGTVHGFARPTDLNDTNCSAIDACASARGCTELTNCQTQRCDTYDPAVCPSVIDACPTGRGCTPLFPCA